MKVNEVPKEAKFISDSQDVFILNEMYKVNENYDSFFVIYNKENEIIKLYGMYGIVPYNYQIVYEENIIKEN